MSFQSNLNGHPNLIGYVDSTISLLDGGVHEVLLLMPYHKTTLLQTMNDRINSGRFSEAEVVDIFCDVCTAVSRLHHCQTPIIHRDLKVSENSTRLLGDQGVLCNSHYFRLDPTTFRGLLLLGSCRIRSIGEILLCFLPFSLPLRTVAIWLLKVHLNNEPCYHQPRGDTLSTTANFGPDPVVF
jgi:serine/threonine protein kinase